MALPQPQPAPHALVPDLPDLPDIPALPALTNSPTSHPDSCLSLSTPLLQTLLSLSLPLAQGTNGNSNGRILSIGSGTGLLEALLNKAASSARGRINITVHGVEPHPGSANKYLPPTTHLHLVNGTWAVLGHETACTYAVWWFVYPRERGLVRRYLDMLPALDGTPGFDGLRGCVTGSQSQSCSHSHSRSRSQKFSISSNVSQNQAKAKAEARARARAQAQTQTRVERDGADFRVSAWQGAAYDGYDECACGGACACASGDVKVLVWAGPKADWEDFAGEFRRDGISLREVLQGSRGGVAEWEVVVVFDWFGGGGGGLRSHAHAHDDEQGMVGLVSIDDI